MDCFLTGLSLIFVVIYFFSGVNHVLLVGSRFCNCDQL